MARKSNQIQIKKFQIVSMLILTFEIFLALNFEI